MGLSLLLPSMASVQTFCKSAMFGQSKQFLKMYGVSATHLKIALLVLFLLFLFFLKKMLESSLRAYFTVFLIVLTIAATQMISFEFISFLMEIRRSIPTGFENQKFAFDHSSELFKSRKNQLRL